MLKRRLPVLFAAAVMLTALLGGCFLYDETVGDNIGPFVNPESFPDEDFLPDDNAVKVIALPEEEEPETAETVGEDGEIVLGEGHVRLLNPPVVEFFEDGMPKYRYDGDTFSFTVPFLWRDAMVVDVAEETSEEGYELRYYTFYYVPKEQETEPPAEAFVMTVRVAPYDYYLLYGHGENGTTANEGVSETDGLVYTYIRPVEGQEVPEDFPDIGGYIEILRVLTENWDFRQVNAG